MKLVVGSEKTTISTENRSALNLPGPWSRIKLQLKSWTFCANGDSINFDGVLKNKVHQAQLAAVVVIRLSPCLSEGVILKWGHSFKNMTQNIVRKYFPKRNTKVFFLHRFIDVRRWGTAELFIRIYRQRFHVPIFCKSCMTESGWSSLNVFSWYAWLNVNQFDCSFNWKHGQDFWHLYFYSFAPNQNLLFKSY